MRSYDHQGTAKASKVTEVTEVLEASVLNGATLLSAADGTILIADSFLGAVFRLNTHTGAYKIVQDDATMKGSPTGINGRLVRNGVLYFTNLSQNIFVRVPIHRDGTAAGPYKTVVKNTEGILDDFALDIQGNAYVAQGSANMVARIDGKSGVLTEVAGSRNSTAIAGPVSAKFGRTKKDKRTLYVTTIGALAGEVMQGGQLVAVDLLSL